MIDTQLIERINGFVANVTAAKAAYWKEMGYTFADAPVAIVKFNGAKWAKVYTVESGRETIHSFICLEDGESKSMGKVKRGDIHKPATYKAPAKHGRGNVFSEDFGAGCLAFAGGVEYLR